VIKVCGLSYQLADAFFVNEVQENAHKIPSLAIKIKKKKEGESVMLCAPCEESQELTSVPVS